MRNLLKSKLTYVAMRTIGALLIVSYLVNAGDWRMSLPWGLAFPAIAASVSWIVVSLQVDRRFPRLDRRLPMNRMNSPVAPAHSEDEHLRARMASLEYQMGGLSVLSAPLEDGFFCVPLLWVGISPISAVFAGIAFGVGHLARFTYIECMSKALSYALICYWVLPHGLLTVASGHLLTDAIGLVGLKIVNRLLSKQSRSNEAVNRTRARNTAGRP